MVVGETYIFEQCPSELFGGACLGQPAAVLSVPTKLFFSVSFVLYLHLYSRTHSLKNFEFED